jgi:hypothetical protein
MLEKKVRAAHEIGRHFKSLKVRGNDAFERSLELLNRAVAARNELGLPPDYGAAAIADAAAATQLFAEGNHRLALSHRRFAAHKVDLDLPTTNGGDECPLPLFEVDYNAARLSPYIAVAA